MKIETLLTEAEISEEFAEAMEARDVPEKFFYWQPLCVRSWLALSRGVAYESRLHSWIWWWRMSSGSRATSIRSSP